ncbi:UTP--glucose-1-phosphate uridylyltransferase [Streptomyces sp. NPDC102441]|uniref:UTP--glucose-1-phosphate uridylyltransferase n=1 Tax=Streptomyces sp. NPDC102441 TaxID=3366176 RepID=UPI0038232C65
MAASEMKCVIPAAGYGTRFLPATKAIPKELMPLVDKPVAQHVLEEAAAAGLRQALMVVGRHKQALLDHFDRSFELEQHLIRSGNDSALAKSLACSGLAELHYMRQGETRGVGHAVLCARSYVGDQPFAVLLPDEVMDPQARLLERMMAVRRDMGGSIVALTRVDPSEIHLYGSARVEPTAEKDVVRITGLIEKPETDEAPSDLAVVGRFILDPHIFGELAHTPPGHGGELQLTDALDTMACQDSDGGPVHGVILSGRRHDTGNPDGYLRATVELACAHTEIGPQFRSWLRTYVADRCREED